MVSSIKPKNDVKNYLIVLSDLDRNMQEDINMYITHYRLNDASLRIKCNPMFKNLLKRKNLLELVFKDIATFDGQNPIIGNLVRENKIGKETGQMNLIKKHLQQKILKFDINLTNLENLVIESMTKMMMMMMMMIITAAVFQIKEMIFYCLKYIILNQAYQNQ